VGVGVWTAGNRGAGGMGRHTDAGLRYIVAHNGSSVLPGEREVGRGSGRHVGEVCARVYVWVGRDEQSHLAG